jgi:hypothetical protein
MSRFPLPFDRLHETPKRNKADFGGRQQIIFQATGELEELLLGNWTSPSAVSAQAA